VIDDAVMVEMAPAGDLIALDLWAGALPPAFGDVPMMRVEPTRWWLIGASGRLGELASLIGDKGALTPMGGGLMRATLIGPGWRSLLGVSGVFDAEGPQCAAGAVVATVIHHVPVWIAPQHDGACRLYVAASYAEGLIELWRATIGHLKVRLSTGPAGET